MDISRRFRQLLGAIGGTINHFLRLPPRAIGIALLITALIGLPDYLIGSEDAMRVFYLIPVAIAAWYAGRNASLLIVAMSALVTAAAETSANYHFDHPFIMLWNGCIHL